MNPNISVGHYRNVVCSIRFKSTSYNFYGIWINYWSDIWAYNAGICLMANVQRKAFSPQDKHCGELFACSTANRIDNLSTVHSGQANQNFLPAITHEITNNPGKPGGSSDSCVMCVFRRGLETVCRSCIFVCETLSTTAGREIDALCEIGATLSREIGADQAELKGGEKS